MKEVEQSVVLEELEYLREFYQHADFGPADGDVRYLINQRIEEGGVVVPEGYKSE